MPYKAWFQCINEKCNEKYPLNTVIYRCKSCDSLLECGTTCRSSRAATPRPG